MCFICRWRQRSKKKTKAEEEQDLLKHAVRPKNDNYDNNNNNNKSKYVCIITVTYCAANTCSSMECAYLGTVHFTFTYSLVLIYGGVFNSTAVAECTLMFYVLGLHEENKTNKQKNNMWIDRLEYYSYQV